MYFTFIKQRLNIVMLTFANIIYYFIILNFNLHLLMIKKGGINIMIKFKLPYDSKTIDVELEEKNFAGLLESKQGTYQCKEKEK